MGLPAIFLKEVHDGHGGDHFSEAGDFSDSVNPLAVVIHILIIFAFPDAPTLGRNLGDTLIAAEELQEISEVLEAFGAVSTSASFVLHGVVVILSLLEDGRRELSISAESRIGC